MYNKEYNKVYKKKYLGNIYQNSYVNYLNLPIKDLKAFTIKQLKDGLLVYMGAHILKFRDKNSGKISHEQADKEYEKFKVKQDMQYISSMDEMYQRYLKENNE